MESQSTQIFSLTPEQSKFVEKCIASGRFKSTDEVVTEGIRLLEAEEAEYQKALEKARRLVKEGVDAVERGETVDAKEAIDRLRKRRENLLSESPKS
ncbi:MAG: type II toxin-antitoxin system ParD family antitoxin [Candidatus Omnitrophica bacterium]|nr:type II toxin-antitoxin system ParD family antitoxin [Candidatus Omnitrophota bacterium]